jgi:hypothetical protein
LPELELTYSTYDATTWKKILLKELPASISHEDVTIWRRDLVPKN